MPDFLKSSASSIFTQVADENGPVSGATVHVTVTDPDAIKVVDDQSAAELPTEPGTYVYVLVPANLSKVGTYRAIWTAVYSDKSLTDYQIFTVGLTPYPNMTIQDVRHMIADTELEGNSKFKLGKVTAVGAGTYTVADWAHLPDSDLIGQSLYVYGGAGVSQEMTVLTHAQTAGGAVISLTSHVVPLASGSLVEVHKHFKAGTYIRAIRRAQMEAADRLGVPMNDRTLVGVSGTSVYEIPSGFVCLDTVLVGGIECELDEWDIVPGRRQIKITASIASGDVIELRGRAKVGDILSDFAVVEVPPAYLIYKVAAMLLRTQAGGPSTDPDSSAQRATFYEGMARDILQRQPQLIRPNSKVVS